MAVTITGLFRNPIRNVPYTDGTVEVAIGDAFGVGDIGYISNARSYKVTADGMNGSGGISLVVDDGAPSDVSFLLPDGVTTAVVSVDGADTSQTLEDLLTVGGDAPTGGTILVQGMVNDPQTNAPRIGMRIEIALVEMFATEDGVHLPAAKSFRMTEYGINNDDVDSLGVTLYVPTGIASQWRFDFYASYADDAPLLWSSTAYFDDSMSVVEVADVLDGLYATWTEPMVAPSNAALVVSGATRNEVTFTWDDNSDDETGFEVASSPNGTDWELLTTTAAGVETYTHTTAHGTYPLNLGLVALRYRVRAVKSGGLSGWATKTESTKGLLFRLKAAYNLDEASGTRASVLGGFSLTEEVGAASSAAGLIGNAVDGSDNVRLNNDSYSIPSGTQFAIAAWVYWGGSSGAGNWIIALYPDATGERLGIITRGTTTIGIEQMNGATAAMGLTLDEWGLVVFGYDGTNTVYSVNGAAKQTLYAGAKAAAWSRLWVGSENTNSTYRVDLLNWYYDHFPSAAQITALYNAGAGRAYPY